MSQHKLDIGGAYRGFFPQHMLRNNFEWLTITDDHLGVVAGLEFHHKDPFDRLLIAQATWESLPVVSADSQFDAYPIARRW